MTKKENINETTAAMSVLQTLATEKAQAEANIVECQRELIYAKEMLASVQNETITPTNIKYIESAKAAWQASIDAYQASVDAYQNDIDSYDSEILQSRSNN